MHKPGRYDARTKAKAEDRSFARFRGRGLARGRDQTRRLKLVLDEKGDVLRRQLPSQVRAGTNADFLEGPLAANPQRDRVEELRHLDDLPVGASGQVDRLLQAAPFVAADQLHAWRQPRGIS